MILYFDSYFSEIHCLWAPLSVNEDVGTTPHLLKFPATKMSVDYDEEADVLYISFKRKDHKRQLTQRCWRMVSYLDIKIKSL